MTYGKDQRLTSVTPLPPCEKHHVRSLHCHHFQEIQEDWGRCSSPALITCLENPAIITAPKINHWTMGVTGVIQPMEVINSHPISGWAHKYPSAVIHDFKFHRALTALGALRWVRWVL